MLYGRQVSTVAWPRCGLRCYFRGITPLSASIRIPNALCNPSALHGCTARYAQARSASIWTIFKSWQQQETGLPIYSKNAKSRPNFDPSMSPLRAILPGGGGGSVSPATKEGFGAFGCSYTRISSDQRKDDEDLDIASIEALIEERIDARREHNFELADAKREELKRNYGVYLDDRGRTWSTEPFVLGGNFDKSSRLTERFGPQGHDYKLCADAGRSISPLSEDDIHKLIAERLWCKLNREFERADAIKVELTVKEVAIDDIRRMWRSDGLRIYTAEGHNNKLNYTYAPDAGPSQSTMNNEDVVKLLAARQECRYNRDFVGADLLLADLREARVQVDDENRLWRADGKPFRSENRDGHNDEDLFGETETYHGDKGSDFR
jgi:hypothetical protein